MQNLNYEIPFGNTEINKEDKEGDSIGVKISERIRRADAVYKVTDR